MKKNLLSIAAFLSVGLLLESASAQVFFSAGSPYTQNFDTLASSGTANAWTDDSTLPAWYASRVGGGPAVTTYRAGTGTDGTGAVYSYGTAGVNPATDRALGSIGSNTTGNEAYGVRFQNDTALAITNITITYTGEQWRNGGNTTPHTLAFSYFISSSQIISSDAANANPWVAVGALDFITPIATATAGALDGNAAANRQVFANVLLTNAIVFPGQEIFFRWYDNNDSGNDHGVALDDLTISFTSISAVMVAPDIAPSGQPESRTNNAGTRATFTVTATGSNPSYQWRLNNVDLFNGVKISGANGPTLSISNVLAIDEGTYTVYVANSAGSITSSNAVLTVIDPAVNTPPASHLVIAGDTGDFYVRAAGTIPLSYQWRHNGSDIADATTSSLNVLNVQSPDQGSYTVVVGNVNGNYTTSAVGTLTLLVTPATCLARWNFNDTNTLDLAAPTASTGAGTAALLNGVTAQWAAGTYADPAGPPSDLNNAWNTSSYPPQGTSNKTAGVQFNVSTLGYHNLLLAWQQRHSATASKYTRLQYTTDGVNFADGDLITMINTNSDFVFYQSDLSGILGVNNNPNFAFRIVPEWESTAIGGANDNYVGTANAYGTGGTIRYDLVGVYADAGTGPVVAPTTINSLAGSTLSYSGGAGSQFVLLSSANPATPLAGWSRIHTNYATPGIFTVPTGSGSGAFYRIKSE